VAPMVSASLLDNKISFDKVEDFRLDKKVIPYNNLWEKYSPIEIKSWLGLGKTLFKGALTEHTEVCGNDNNCFSTMEIYLPNDGTLVDDTIVECVYYLTNNVGTLLDYFPCDFGKDGGRYGYWNATVLEGNFTYSGDYFYGIKCNSTEFGGAITGRYRVNNQALEPTNARAILYFGLLLILILLIVGAFLLFFKLERFKKSPEGQIMDINKLSFLRLPVFGLIYSFIMSLMYISANLSYTFLGEELFGDFFFAIFTLMMKLLVPMIIMIGLWFIAKIVDDKKILGEAERGFVQGGGGNI